jgi:ferritin
MISDKIHDAFNDQLNFELASAYLYYSMALWLQSENFDGMASWMRAQAAEEMGHVERFSNHLIDRDTKVELKQLPMSKTSWDSPVEAFQDALAHEKKVTGRIHNLVALASDEKDRASLSFLEWFVNEQIEEESNVSKIVTDLTRIGDFGYGQVMMDRELGARIASMPSAGEGEA